jgi:hypothetical protein
MFLSKNDLWCQEVFDETYVLKIIYFCFSNC